MVGGWRSQRASCLFRWSFQMGDNWWSSPGSSPVSCVCVDSCPTMFDVVPAISGGLSLSLPGRGDLPRTDAVSVTSGGPSLLLSGPGDSAMYLVT